MNLEFKHIQHYLLTDLKIIYFDELIGCFGGYMEGMEFNPVRVLYNGQDNRNLNADMESEIFLKLEDIKIILRPLSDLTKEIEVNGERFVPIKKCKKTTILKHVSKYPFDFKDLEFERYDVMLLLFQWHFDFQGLIEKGLAVDINTLSVQNDG
jgi:hypothetical protein